MAQAAQAVHNTLFNHGNAEAGPSKLVYIDARREATPSSDVAEAAMNNRSPSRTDAARRRSVIFSAKNDTKVFHSQDSIVPVKDVPPPSIRSYLDSDPLSPTKTPSPLLTKPRLSSPTPSLVRSILKSRYQEEIRIAASVEEGTQNNKEPARLMVSGKRPKLVARDSFQLAMLRKAADDGVNLEKMEDAPGSDDSVASEDGAGEGKAIPDNSSEIEEPLEASEELDTSSLLDIILDGAEDLLTLEEAYGTLVIRLKTAIKPSANSLQSAQSSTVREETIHKAVQPIRDNAPAIIRALQRDLQRLLGKVPNSEFPSDVEGSPFRALIPLRDSTPINRNRFTPSPTPINGKKTDAPRQGYTEAEVRYRREAAGVGGACLKFLAFIFHEPKLFSNFTDADLSALLETIMIIPRTPKLPTPNTKKTYHLSIFVIAQMKIPITSVQPAREKIARAIESAISENLGSSNAASGSKEGPSAIKKEAFMAIINMLTNYPALFFQHYSELLPACIKGLTSSSPIIRTKAAAAMAAYASAKISVLSSLQEEALKSPDSGAKEIWIKGKATAQKCENFISTFLKGALRIPGRANPVYGTNGEKKTELSALEQVFKDTVGNNADVAWACAAWSSFVTLLGSSYGRSGASSGLDHILDRSLQASNNLIRPTLARVAWNHAAHAYLSTGSASSITDNGKLIQSWNPFITGSHQSSTERTHNIALPVQLALNMATAPDSASLVLQEATESNPIASYYWSRTEKAKKHQWMITCGLSAAGYVYAYTGMALYHQDQPAKEISAVSGLPSSDGAPIPETAVEDSTLQRLDNTWDKVVEPILHKFMIINGVDRLKLHGWSILLALTSQKPSPELWTLDRLLSTRYLNLQPEAFNSLKDTGLETFIKDLENDSIKTSEIPGWGSTWISTRLDQLLRLFVTALSGIRGLDDSVDTRAIRGPQGQWILPAVLSRVWCNLIRAVAVTKSSEHVSSKVYMKNLRMITSALVEIFNLDPASYIPVSLLNPDKTYKQDIDETKTALFHHLFAAVDDILGRDAVATIRLDFSTMEEAAKAMVIKSFGADAEGKPTMAGLLLGQLLRPENLSSPMTSSARQAFKILITKVLKAGLAPGQSGKLLGDMTNSMPFLFEQDEQVQLEIWRLLAITWTETIDLQPSTNTGASTNHTGALLVSLLSGPFRGRLVTSVWHSAATPEDLGIWQSLLKVTVLRFRAKKVGSNLGVLESLAAHLGDFLEQGQKTISSTITLSCLASAISWITFVPTELYHASHFINENTIPTDFLELVGQALDDSYPSNETLSIASSHHDISPAVGDVIEQLSSVFQGLPLEYVEGCLDPIQASVAIWMDDTAKVVEQDLGQKLDHLYITLLSVLSSTIQQGLLPNSAETLDRYIDIYAPRLSRALSPAVPKAFQAFWRSSFRNVDASDLSPEVAQFLGEVVAAVPGMIDVRGLNVSSSMSEEESLARFPNAQELAITTKPIEIIQPSPEMVPESSSPGDDILVDTSRIDDSVVMSSQDAEQLFEPEMPSVEYDADVSQNTEETQQRNQVIVPPTAEKALDTVVEETDTERSSSPPVESPINAKRTPAPDPDANSQVDVFGPGGAVATKSRKRSKPSRPSQTSTLPEIKVAKSKQPIARSYSTPNPVAYISDDSDMESIIFVDSSSTKSKKDKATTKANSQSKSSPGGSKKSILASVASAGKWLSKVPPFGSMQFFSSPVQPIMVNDDDDEIPDSDDAIKRPKRDQSGSDKARKRDIKAMNEKLKSARASSRSSSRASSKSSTISNSRKVPVVELVSQKRKKRKTDHDHEDSRVESIPEEVMAIEDDEEEDELLLSPETARKRNAEEYAELQRAKRHQASPSKRAKLGHGHSQSQSQQSSGRFEDALEDQSRFNHVPPSPSHPARDQDSISQSGTRSSQQSRVLNMVEEAARARNAIENLDFEGVTKLLKHIDELRDAATANLENRVQRERKSRSNRA